MWLGGEGKERRKARRASHLSIGRDRRFDTRSCWVLWCFCATTSGIRASVRSGYGISYIRFDGYELCAQNGDFQTRSTKQTYEPSTQTHIHWVINSAFPNVIWKSVSYKQNNTQSCTSLASSGLRFKQHFNIEYNCDHTTFNGALCFQSYLVFVVVVKEFSNETLEFNQLNVIDSNRKTRLQSKFSLSCLYQYFVLVASVSKWFRVSGI